MKQIQDFLRKNDLGAFPFELDESKRKASLGDWSRGANPDEEMWPRAEVLFATSGRWTLLAESPTVNLREQIVGKEAPDCPGFSHRVRQIFSETGLIPPTFPAKPTTLEDISDNTFDLARQAVMAQTKAPGKSRATFWVPSTPKSQLRTSQGKDGKRFTNSKTTSARQDIVHCFQEKAGSLFRPWDGPVLIEVIDCHYKKTAFYGEHVRKKPDWDNSGKLVGDALNGVAWSDDAIIISGLPQKTYWPWAGKWCRITFCHPIEKPKTGLDKLSDDLWNVLYHGVLVGSVVKEGSRHKAFRCDSLAGLHPIEDPDHKTGHWRLVSHAETAILETCKKGWVNDAG